MPPCTIPSNDKFAMCLLSEQTNEESCRDQDKLSVHFDPRGIKVHTVERYEEVAPGQIWYTKEEYSNIKMRDILIVRLMAAKSFHESSEHTFRGLEGRNLNGKFDNRHAQQAAQAILHQQNQQALRGICSPEHIARIYGSISCVAKRNAALIAQHDAEYVVLSQQQAPNVKIYSPSRAPIRRTASLDNDAISLQSSMKGKDELGDSIHLAKIPRRRTQRTRSSDHANFGFTRFVFKKRSMEEK